MILTAKIKEERFKFLKVLIYAACAGLIFIGIPAFAQTASLKDLSEPYISISPDIFYPLEEILYLEGRSEPDAVVTVTLTKGGDQPVKFTVRADSGGEWVVAEKTYLAHGNWEVRARAQVGGAVSGWSNPRIIRSVVTGVNFFGMNIRYVVIAAVSLIFLLTVGILALSFHRKVNRLKRGLMEKQLKETEERFHKGFSEIRKDLMDQLKNLAVNSQGRSLTPEEIERRDHILRELEELEKGLEHDIGDISKRY